jgi:ferritin-like metal-binding protein YciE
MRWPNQGTGSQTLAERSYTVAAVQSPQDLFLYFLCAMYDVEEKLTEILPTLAEEVQQSQVRTVFLRHQQETRQHVLNLEQCFQILGHQPMALKNHAMAGLKKDHDDFLQQHPSKESLTMFNLGAGTRSEYLEMAAYIGLIDAAINLGLQQCVPLFQQNLQQEEMAARDLVTLARQLGQTAGLPRPPGSGAGI